MTPADERDPHDDTDSYVVDTRRRRGRMSGPRNPLGGASRITGRRRPDKDRRPESASRGDVGWGDEPVGQARGGGAAYPAGAAYDDRWDDGGRSGTRQMPVQPSRPAQPPTSPPQRPRGAGPGRPPRRVHRRRRVVALVLVALLAWIAFLVVTPLHAWSSVSNVDATPAGDRPARVSGYNYLLVGSDSRAGLSPEEQQQLATGDDAGQRTDSIILVHVSESGQKSALVSLPRDSYVPIPGHNRSKINAAYSIGGPQLLVETVEQATGVHVDGYVEIGFGGFARVVDSLGGASVNVPFDMNDEKAGINLKKGEQTLTGPQALGFVRSRYSDPEGDLGRAKRQRQFLGAIMRKAASPATVLLPWRYWGFTHSAAEGVKIGDGTSPADLTRVLQAMRASSGADGQSLVVPISNPAYPTAAGVAVKWDTTKAQAFFDKVKNDQPLP